MEQAEVTVGEMTAAQRAVYWEREAGRWRDAFRALLAGVEAAKAIAFERQAD